MKDFLKFLTFKFRHKFRKKNVNIRLDFISNNKKEKLQSLSSTIRQQTIIRHIEQIVAKSLRLQLWLAAADFPH